MFARSPVTPSFLIRTIMLDQILDLFNTAFRMADLGPVAHIHTASEAFDPSEASSLRQRTVASAVRTLHTVVVVPRNVLQH